MGVIICGVVAEAIEEWFREGRCPGYVYRVLVIENLAVSREEEVDAVVVYCCSYVS